MLRPEAVILNLEFISAVGRMGGLGKELGWVDPRGGGGGEGIREEDVRSLALRVIAEPRLVHQQMTIQHCVAVELDICFDTILRRQSWIPRVIARPPPVSSIIQHRVIKRTSLRPSIGVIAYLDLVRPAPGPRQGRLHCGGPVLELKEPCRGLVKEPSDGPEVAEPGILRVGETARGACVGRGWDDGWAEVNGRDESTVKGDGVGHFKFVDASGICWDDNFAPGAVLVAGGLSAVTFRTKDFMR